MIDSADIVKRTRAAVHRSTMVSKDHALANAAVAIEQQHVELVELKHDINRHIEIAANLATENEKLTYQLAMAEKALLQARAAISSLPMDTLGFASAEDEQIHWPIRDELIHHIDSALSDDLVKP